MKEMKDRIGAILLLIGLISPIASAHNSVLDPSFEQESGRAPEYWKIEGKGQAVVVDTQSHSGVQALEMTNEGLANLWAVFKYERTINPYYSYLIEAAFKLDTREIAGPGTWVGLRLASTGKVIFTLEPAPAVDLWQGWNVYQAVFVPEEHGIYQNTEVEIVIYRGGLFGTAWIDDLWFEEIRPPSPYIMLYSDKVYQGESIIVKGGDFLPLKWVDIFLGPTQLTDPMTIKTNAQGRFEAEIAIPTWIIGHNSLRASSPPYEATLGLEVLASKEPEISGWRLDKDVVAAGQGLKVEVTADKTARVTVSIEAVVNNFSLQRIGDLELFTGEVPPSMFPVNRATSALVTIKATKGGLTNVKEAGQIFINTIVPVISPWEGPNQVQNGDIVSFAVKVEPVEYSYNVQMDFYPLDDTKTKPITLPLCATCASAGVYKQTIRISTRNTREDGLKRLRMTATNEAGNMSEAYIEVWLENIKPLPLPEIISFTFSPLQITAAGQELKLTLIGETGCAATASIAGIADIDLIENVPGLYQGTFLSYEGIDIQDGLVSAELSKDGRTSAIQAEQKIMINTVPPPEPEPEPEQPEQIEQKTRLAEGMNFFALLVNPGDWWLSDLARYVGPNLGLIIWYDIGQKKFISYKPAMPAKSSADKIIQPGEGYIVIMQKPAEVVFTGQPWWAE